MLLLVHLKVHFLFAKFLLSLFRKKKFIYNENENENDIKMKMGAVGK